MTRESDDLEKLRRLRASVEETPVPARSPAEALPSARAPRAPESPRSEAAPSTPSLPPAPDGAAVNRLWDVREASSPSGLSGALARMARRLLAPVIEAQAFFNSRQVQLDNQILEYLDARFDATHRHYDTVLGIHGRHMEDIDKRHLILQEELVAHVHDLVRRIDLILEDSERNRLSLEAALRELRARFSEIEQQASGKR
ncbi:MAG: hypothetical protein JXO72_12370 [Vicinamibacteria bacterium]|nr:hypothetical protein [Vicinamibacteria bacterium]